MSKLKIKNQISKLRVAFFVFISLFTINYSLFTPSVHAQVNIGTIFNSPIQTFGQLVSIIISNVYIVAGVILLVLMLFGGLMVIQGAGAGDQQKTGQGKQAFTSAVIGFLIIFASYWIIQIVESITGLEIFKPTYFQ